MMAQRSRDTFQKREREKDKQQKQKDKEARRLEAKKARAERGPTNGNEDPDLAGIKPGPQPLPEQWQWAVRQGDK
jgi:hypothetical protein